MGVTWACCTMWEAWTDMFPEFGGDSSAQTDNFMTKRASSLATYRNTDFFGIVDGLDLTLQYQGKNEGRGCEKAEWRRLRDIIGAMISAAAILPSAALIPIPIVPMSKTSSAAEWAIKPKPGRRV
ncbi:outer membrane phosphoporin protein E [Salmonella enterica subsp. arizonae]|uniref:Outer membrane phosphoporin protein E n=1 Tax=Salmonella enterica subsp. arizonae TaxID=59203 RepID=A0A379TI35_SALER|nr:outer membrane phosphoporin protein E [Salmonella enterica subsp. arizonae]